ncbi:uncharacterized protein LOC132197683 isoform X1 [Neocloeon triangulifer]|uniref:uncharacterized protein LOC132197683 isoform X1 n=1 Tax=Neocloeon triangulifer TaxID=2078957 RepID=UPI00286F4C24|nr:uncharacterized protein LOC132197683 isoform X1 [Neocloeon triangulifer]
MAGPNFNSTCLFLLLVCFVQLGLSRKVEPKKDHCNKTVEIYEDVTSPEVTSINEGKPMTCWYRFRSYRGTPRDWILRIKFKKFKVGTLVNATSCVGGYLQIVDGNTKTEVSNRRDPGVFCGEIEQPQTFISETSFVKVQFHTDNFTDQTYFSFDSRAEQQFEVYLRYGQHPELYPNRRGQPVANTYCERVFRDCRLQTCYVQSPAYPGIYPRNLHCKYYLNTRLPFIKLYIENEEFNIDGQRCENIMTCPMRPISAMDCPYDYLRIYDGKDETGPIIGTFCGMGKFPYSIIGTSEDLFVEFVTSEAGPLLNTGFHFNVGNWPGHVETAGVRNGTCNWIMTSEQLAASGDSEGIFLSVAHWYPPHTSCTYLIKGKPGEVVRLYFPSFRINRIESPIRHFDGDCGESLTIYDASWPDDSKIIKTFCDTFSKAMEKHDFVSTTESLFVRFESKTGSYSGSSLYYWAHYDFFDDRKSGEALAGTQCDETFHSWKRSYGTLRSPRNTLVYKKSASTAENVSCTYRFITDKRVFGRVILTVTNIAFKDHPYSTVPCNECWHEQIDRLQIWEPTSLNLTDGNRLGCLCKDNAKTLLPLSMVSKGDRLNVRLLVEHSHAASNYFKHSAPLFEARYQFIHGPACGPATISASNDGELHFPHKDYYMQTHYASPQYYYADSAHHQSTSAPHEQDNIVRCIWELKVHKDRDLWLHVDKIKFSSRSCEDGRLEFYLPHNGGAVGAAIGAEPWMRICGENVSQAKDIPIVTNAELLNTDYEAVEDNMLSSSIFIHFYGRLPARSAFKLAWTELFHLPRNSDGSVATQRLSADCEFLCPGDSGACISSRLVCNGVQNCPNVSSVASAGGETHHDESPDLCKSHLPEQVNWLAIALGATGGAIVAACFIGMLCRACHKRDDDDEPY